MAINIAQLNIFNRIYKSKSSRLLQILVGIYFIFRFITEFRFTQFIFSASSNMSDAQIINAYFLQLLTLLAASLLILGIFTRISTLICLAVFTYLGNLSMNGDGGDNILRIVLFYMLLFDDRLARKFDVKPSLRIAIHNLGVIAIIVQVSILYLTAGTIKLSGETWINGTALYYVSHVEQYSTPYIFIRDLFKNPYFVTLSTYSTIIYQLGFAFMLNNRYHLIWVILGIVFHIGVGFVMGLLTFSFVMIALILFTLSNKEWDLFNRNLQLVVEYSKNILVRLSNYTKVIKIK